MTRLEELVRDLDLEINTLWDEYGALHKELDTYRGKPIGDDVEVVNKILRDIQDKFVSIYPAYNFITYRHQYVLNAVNGHNDFIDMLKKAGAMQEGEEKSLII